MSDPAANPFSNRTVLITGSSGNIGSRLVDYFLSIGAYVIATARSGSITEHANLTQIKGDLSEVGSGELLISAALQVHSQIDFIINNAARQDLALLADSTPQAAGEIVQVNFLGVAEILIAAARIKRRPEAILNISSIEALNARPGHGLYGASKAALESLTRSSAVELAPCRVNALRLGLIEKTGIEQAWPEGVGLWQKRAPLQRMGTSSDVAKAVAFLLSSEWVTGTALTLDGGMSANSPW